MLKHEHIIDKFSYRIDQLEGVLKPLDWIPVFKDGKKTRSSLWFTSAECKCPYVYSGKRFANNTFKEWMTALCEDIKNIYGYMTAPNAINLNKYDNNLHGIPYHSDDENLFRNPDPSIDDVHIISLSVGTTRQFRIKKFHQADNEAAHMDLENGDLSRMMGATQTHYEHSIPYEKCSIRDAAQTRYNLTFRWVQQHAKRKCPLAN